MIVLATALAVMMALTAIPGQADADYPYGQCGDAMEWDVLGSDVISVTGCGHMYDYHLNEIGTDAPWYLYLDQEEKINNVSMILFGEYGGGDDLYSIGNYAFAYLPNLANFYARADSVGGDETHIMWIGTHAFEMCSSLEKALTDESVAINAPFLTTIGTYAYAKCSAMTSADFDRMPNLKRIEDYAYMDCTSLTSAVLPENLKYLGKGAFKGCTNLTTVYLPSSLYYIGEGAFEGCTNLTTIYIENEFTDLTIGSHAFDGCPIVFSDNTLNLHGNIKLLPEALATLNIQTLNLYGTFELGKNAISPGLKTINAVGFLRVVNDAFSGYTNLSSIKAEEVEICSGAFDGCTALESIDLSEVTSLEEYAFRGCASLTGVNLSKITVTVVPDIPRGAFDGCTALTSIDLSSAISVDQCAFMDCRSLTEVNMPNVTVIPNNAFSGCVKLESVTMPCVSSIGDLAFAMCPLCDLSFTNSVTIGMLAFQNSKNLTKLAIGGDAVIGVNAFLGSKVQEVTIGGTAKVDVFAFQNNSALRMFSAGSILEVGNGAFSGCSNLEAIDLSNVKSVGMYAFDGCASLKAIDLGDSIKKLGSYAFKNCASIESLSMPASIALNSTTFAGCNNIDTVKITPGNGKKVNYNEPTGLPWQLSSDCKVTLAGGTNIGAQMFWKSPAVTELKFTGPVSIGDYAFGYCTGLQEAIFPIGTICGAGAFKGCTSIVKADIPAGSVIPASLYEGCTMLRNILPVPNGTEEIGNYAFAGCPLERIVLPKSVRIIGDYAFAGCDPEFPKTLTIWYGVERVGDHAFEGFTKLEKLVIMDGIGYVGAGSFAGCTSLRDISIPIDVNLFPAGEPIFDNLASLESITFTTGSAIGCDYAAGTTANIWSTVTTDDLKVTIGEGVERIGDYMFNDLRAMKEFVITDYVKEVGDYAFAYCTDMVKITLGYSIRNAGEHAFVGCTSLDEIMNKSRFYRDIKGGDKELGGVALYAENIHGRSLTIADYDYSLSINEEANDCFILRVNMDVVDWRLPESITKNGITVTNFKIGSNVFKDASNLETINLGNNCLSVGRDAFALEPGQSSSLSMFCYKCNGGYIGIDAFKGHDGLTQVILEHEISISLDAFPDVEFVRNGSIMSGNYLAGENWAEENGVLVPTSELPKDPAEEAVLNVVAVVAVCVAVVTLFFNIFKR